MNTLIKLNENDLLEINCGVWPWVAAVVASKATPYVVAGTIFVGGVIVGFVSGE